MRAARSAAFYIMYYIHNIKNPVFSNKYNLLYLRKLYNI